ncbi:ABC transporter ATP-binding protein [Kocuria sp. p3-SID1433]|uniref:ABC transporter ATP-binding protein n=1 Tax=unclassified Kocuria TaxID=2649579 RepID=UPI0021A4DC16|nr:MULTISPECIES: ABC transporter ATP-binding protein [unclassified Kocuria]MCT1602693.1 ABC transporter ATP-binding protein [Kocuria sp. p3-SID1428]MCT2180240.1 ABC transporter ATP-binding protein [Kocuria sp. p3-SID1433]
MTPSTASRALGRRVADPSSKASVETALSVSGLDLGVTGGRQILHDIAFELHPGRILALVGESGSGKTTAALACMAHLRPGLELRGGSIALHPGASRFHPDGAQLAQLSPGEVRRLRGSTIAYVPQDPALSLNGSMRVGEQIAEVLRIHDYGDGPASRKARVAQVLEEVGMPSDAAAQRRYPHQLSGGQQQRIGIAMAFATRPAVIILDEPTTGLDVATQDLVLDTVTDLTRRHDAAGLYITHDIAVVAQIADEVAVMLKGRIVEAGSAEQVLRSPSHDYTRRLVAAVPDLEGRKRIGGGLPVAQRGKAAAEGAVSAADGDAPVVPPWAQGSGPDEESAQAGSGSVARTEPEMAGAIEPRRDQDPTPQPSSRPLLAVEDLSLSYGPKTVLDGLRLELHSGQTTMLLGESGSGKTTLARAIAGLSAASWTGQVLLDGQPLAETTRKRTPEQRRRIQYIFQSPFSSLNPRRTIGESLAVPLRMGGGTSAAQRREAVSVALDQVRLGRSYIDRRPGDLSGGERQRAAIARALVSAPSVLVCDEVTSALDVSVQASVIELLREIQDETGMAMLFVTHNITLSRHIAHRLAVLQKGRIVDHGLTEDVLAAPDSEYTRDLLEHVLTL